MRSGTRTDLKRRWTPKGHRPVCQVKIGYEYVYLYAALNPYSGKLIALLVPQMTKECFAIFMAYFKEQVEAEYGSAPVLLVLDRASNHQEDVICSDQILLQKLPRCSPELNPAERFFEALRIELSNQVFADAEAVMDFIAQILQKYYENPALICSLTLFPYIRP